MENDDTKGFINQNLEEQFITLIKGLNKKIEDLESKMNKLIDFQQNTISLEGEIKASGDSEKVLFDQMSQQFNKIDVSLGRYFQKFNRDNNKLFDRLIGIEKLLESVDKQPLPIQAIKVEPIKVIKSKPSPMETREFKTKIPEPKNEYLNRDRQEIKELKLFFFNKDVFTTGAIKIIEDTRDKLLFDRDTEAHYRAFAAKSFREILAIIKHEKDFSTLTTQAIKDIQRKLDLLYDRI